MNAYDDPLYRESIPIRITPPPGTGRGPTAQWQATQPSDDLPVELELIDDPGAEIYHPPFGAAS